MSEVSTLEEIKSRLELLQKNIEKIVKKLYPEIEGLSQVIYEKILYEKGGYTSDLNELERVVKEAYLESWGTSADFQEDMFDLEEYERLTDYSELVEAAAVSQGGLVKRSFLAHAQKIATASAVAVTVGYLALVVNETVVGAAKNATDSLGDYYAPTHKQFARARAVEEPREGHQLLEESIIAFGDLWDINGYLVHAPRDPSLPPSERFNCQHVNIYMILRKGNPLLKQVTKRDSGIYVPAHQARAYQAPHTHGACESTGNAYCL